MADASTVCGIISCLCTPNCLYEQLALQCNYLRKRKEKAEKMKEEMKQLSDHETDIKKKLELAEVQKGKEPDAVVAGWLQRVQNIDKEVKILIDEVGEDQRCLNGCFPNYYSRLKLGKHIEDKIKMVSKLLDESKLFNEQLPNLQQEKMKPLSTTTLVGKQTTERNFEKIRECIMDNNIGVIGVFGMGGVGKTTIMQHIHNSLLKESTHFDEVIWITVSSDSNLEKLQIDIGKKLNLDLKNYEDEISRASELLAALKRRKRFMLILDDMWKTFTLEEVGIPNPTRDNGCKVVLTTRSQKVCRGMKTEADVEVRVLSEDEAWHLFKDQVGEDVLRSSDILDVAKKVAKECDGLPLALTIVGKALRKEKNVSVWEYAFKKLRDSTADIEDIEEKVFKRLKYSYDRLKSARMRDCFLYCALYPEDHNIESTELVEHWIGEERLIDDLEHREDQIKEGITVLEDLKNVGMLENSDRWVNEGVKMHDLVRDLAIRIQSPKCIIKTGFGSKEVPRDEEWKEDLERISLMRNKLEQLTGEPKCSKLTSLLLQCNPIMDISPSFFQHMCNLRVVNLSYTDMEFLPKSLFELENLRVLLLNNCGKLKKLHSVENLKSLRTLDLSNTSITELPPGMEMLVNLRRLDLWNCKLKMCPAKLLQKLTLLEELAVMCESYSEGEGEDPDGEKGEESDGEEPEGEKGKSKGEETEEDEPEVTCLEELIKDTHLRRLDVYFKNSKNFNRYIGSGHWRQLARFTLFCKTTGHNYNSRPAGKNYMLIEHVDMNVGGTWLMLPDTTHELGMRNCDTLTRLSMCLPKSPQLQKCTLEGCNDMECIVMACENNLPSLQRMDLKSLPKLRSLCKGVVAPGTLSSLKELKVLWCDNLKNVLTCGLLQHLQSLEEISIVYCNEMEEIIVGIMGEEDGDEKEKGEAGMMSGGGNKNEGNNKNSIITLPSPTSLPGHNNYLPSLQIMHLQCLPKLRSLCKGVVAPGTLSSLKVLIVRQCNNMKNLLTRGLLQHLQSLEEIRVVACSRMEEIIGGEGEEDEKERGGEEGIISSGTINNNAIITSTLPRLHTLVLNGLGELKSICSSSRGVMVCNSLQAIHVDKCPKLKKLPIVNMEEDDNNGGIRLMGAPPGLKKIIGNNKKWWDPQTSDHPDAHTFLQPFKTRV